MYNYICCAGLILFGLAGTVAPLFIDAMKRGGCDE